MEMSLLVYRLVNSSPEAVFTWLEENKRDAEPLGESREELEKALLSRNEKLINLGLSLYGENKDIAYELYRSSDISIKKAVLAGRTVSHTFDFIEDFLWILKDDVLPSLISEITNKSSDEEIQEAQQLLDALFNNPYLPVRVLENLFKKEGIFENIDEKTWVLLVAMASSNERLTKPYDSVYLDGYHEWEYNKVFKTAWDLFKLLPVTNVSASVLERLANKLVLCPLPEAEAEKILDRWKDDSNSGNKSSRFYARIAFIKNIPNSSKLFQSFRDSDELALRMGYYTNVSGRDFDEKDIVEWAERDAEDFVTSAIRNSSFFHYEEHRYSLDTAIRDMPDKYGDLVLRNQFIGAYNFFDSQNVEENKTDKLSKNINDIHVALGLDTENHALGKLERMEIRIQGIGESVYKIESTLRFLAPIIAVCLLGGAVILLLTN